MYTQDYYSIDWPAQRNQIAEVDLYAPHTKLFDFLYSILRTYEPCAIQTLRRAAMDAAYKLIVQEDENTGYQTLGPVSKMMNLIVRAHVEGSPEAVEAMLAWLRHGPRDARVHHVDVEPGRPEGRSDFEVR